MKHFEEVLNTLGAGSVSLIGEGEHWDFWSADYKTPVQVVTGYYLYLKSTCPKQEATSTNLTNWRQLSQNQGYEVIVLPSSDLTKSLEVTNSLFHGKGTRTSKQFLQDNFLKDLKWKSLEEEEYFVDPSIQRPSGDLFPSAKLCLTNWFLRRGTNTLPALGVLTANGGVGKTTLSRILCSELKRKDPNVIPVLVESKQWRSMLLGTFTLDAIWDMALAKRFENASRLTSNPTALRVLIREGLMAIVFDGFDELCINSGAPYSPKDLISELHALVTPEDTVCEARVLLTARRTFWSSIADDIDTSNIAVFELKEFDNEQKKKYFANRLKIEPHKDLAFRIARQISGGVYEGLEIEEHNQDRLSGVPFVLDLIARYVEETDPSEINPYAPDSLENLIDGICRRENLRQSLELDPATQLMIFEELFREYPEGFHTDDLNLYLKVIGGVSDPGVMRRFTNHVLLSPLVDGRFGSRYEVLRVYFLARFLARGLVQLSGQTPRKAITRLLAEQSTGKTQLMDWLVAQIRAQEDAVLAFSHALEICRDGNEQDLQLSSEMAICHLANRLLDGDDKAQRAGDIAKLLAARDTSEGCTYYKTVFCGTLRALSLDRTTFDLCRFVDVEFKNCNFSETSRFSNCDFDGTVNFHNCSGEEYIVLSADCRMAREAEFALAQVRKIGSRREIRTALAEDALSRALKRFRGDYGFKSIQYRHRRSGFKLGNPYNETIWDALLSKKVIEKHAISNVSDGGLNVCEDKELRREIASLLDNGVIGKVLSNVLIELTGF